MAFDLGSASCFRHIRHVLRTENNKVKISGVIQALLALQIKIWSSLCSPVTKLISFIKLESWVAAWCIYERM